MGHIKSANIRPFVFIHLESDLHQKLNISGVVCKQCLLKLCKDPHISFWYILLTKLTAHRQTRRHNRAYNQSPFDSWQRSLYEVNLPLSRSVANSHRPLQSTVNRSLKVQQGGTWPSTVSVPTLWLMRLRGSGVVRQLSFLSPYSSA